MKWFSIISFFIFLFVFNCNTASAYYYKQYTTSSGLISNTVYHCIRDSKGFIWFFTDKGVSKFDGAVYKNFTASEGLGDQDIFSGYEDRSGRLWLYTFNGNPCFIKDDKIHNADNDPLLRKIPIISYIASIVENKDSSLYIGYAYGQLIKVSGNNFEWILKKNNKFSDIASMNKVGDTLKVCGTASVKYYVADKLVKSYSLNDNANFYADNVNFYDHDTLLYLDSKGITMFDNYQNTLWQYDDSSLKKEIVMHLYYDKEKIFCGANNGLTIIDTKNKKKQSLFSNTKVSSICQDIYGNYWVTTLGDGIFYLNKNLDRILELKDIHDSKTTVVNNGQVFFVKGSSIGFFENDSLKFLNVKINAGIIPLYITNRYFFYTIGNATYCLDRRNNKTTYIIYRLKNVYPVDTDHFLIAGSESIFDLQLTRNNFVLCSTVSPARTYQSCFDGTTLYFSAGKMLYKYDKTNKTISDVDSLDYPASVSKLYIIKNELVVTTNGENVIYYMLGRGTQRKGVMKYPFACYNIQKLAGDNDRYILNTDKGYFLFNDIDSITRNIQLLEYPVAGQDILSLNLINKNVVCNLNNNYYLFDAALMNNEKRKPLFFIEKIMINGTAYPLDNIVIKNSGHTALSIELSYLKFDLPSVDYEYRIIGSDTTKWLNTQSSRLDIFLEKYGQYIVEIRAITKNKMVSESKYVMLNITPSFYYSFPFYTLVITVLLISIAFMLRYYNKRRLNIYQSELDYLQLEHRAINSLLNPHFIFNAINNIQNLINIGSKENANSYLAVLSKLIRQNIDNLQFSFIPVSEELNLIRNYIKLQNLRFDDKINLIINNYNTDLDDIQIPPLLIHTFVENSVVHGFRKEISNFTITIDLILTIDDYLIITIADNGAGLLQKGGQKITDKLSLGIDFMRKRLTRISDFYKVTFSLDIRDNDEKAGTEVIVTLYAKFKKKTTLKKGSI